MTVSVECYSGTRYAERPVAVNWQGQRLTVQQVLHQWRTPNEVGFDVLVSDGRLFRIWYDEENDRWTIVDIAENRPMEES